MKARILTLLNANYNVDNNKNSPKENKKLDQKRYELIYGSGEEGFGKKIVLLPSFQAAFQIDPKAKTARIKNVAKLMELANKINEQLKELNIQEAKTSRINKMLARYMLCLALICHRNDTQNLTVTTSAANSLKSLLNNPKDATDKAIILILNTKFPPAKPVITTEHSEPLRIQIKSPPSEEPNGLNSAPPMTFSSSDYLKSPNTNASSPSIIKTLPPADQNKTPQSSPPPGYNPGYNNQFTPPIYLAAPLANSENLKDETNLIIENLLKAMNDKGSNKKMQKAFFLDAIKNPLNFQKYPKSHLNRATLALRVLEKLSDDMNNIQLLGMDVKQNFVEIRRERISCLGGGNTTSWQQMRSAVKQEILKRLSQADGKKQVADNYATYTELFSQHSGRFYARGFCGLFSRTKSLKEFKKLFPTAPENSDSDSEVSISYNPQNRN